MQAIFYAITFILKNFTSTVKILYFYVVNLFRNFNIQLEAVVLT